MVAAAPPDLTFGLKAYRAASGVSGPIARFLLPHRV